MKNIFKTIFVSAALLGLASCDDSDNTIDQVLDDVERGAVLRTIPTDASNTELGIGLNDPFAITIEQQDAEGGALLESVRYSAIFADNSEDEGDTAGANFDEFELGTIAASDFTPGPFGLPRFDLVIPKSDLLAGANVADEDLFGGDTFTVFLEMTLTDGRVFNSANAGGIITGGFFASPFQYAAVVTCPVAADFMVGTYAMTIESGVFPYFGIGFGTDWTTQNYEIVAGEGSTQRIAKDLIYLPAFGGFVGDHVFNLVCGSIDTPNQALGGGVGCGGQIRGGTDGTVFGAYDFADDSEFTVSFNVTAGDGSTCPSSSFEQTLKFVKQ